MLKRQEGVFLFTNFMPALGDVRVISEGLEITYKKLQEAMAKESL